MRFLLFITLSFCGLGSTLQALELADWRAPEGSSAGGQGLKPPVVHELRFSMDELDAQVLFRKEPQDRSSFAVKLMEQGRPLHGRVAVKGSFTRNFLKKSLVVKLADAAQWQGRNKFALNAMATDPAQLREWLAWDLINALEIPAPEVAYTRLFINGRYIGLFLLFEWITDATFERWGLGSGGLLFHPDDSSFCGDLALANLARLHECWLNFSPPAGRGQGFAPLQDLVKELAATPVEAFDRYLDDHFHVDSVLDWLVVNAVTSNGDTYNKNYFLHRAMADGRWSVMPWDYDLSFGRNADPALPFPQNILNDSFYYLNPPDLGMPHVLKDKTLRNSALMQRYRARMAHVLGLTRDASASPDAFGWFAPSRLFARIAQVERAIAVDRQREPYRRDPPDAAQQQAEALRWYALMRYHYLQKLLIEPSPFGTARWMAGDTYPLLLDGYPQRVPLSLLKNVDLSAGETWVVPSDDWLGRPLGLLHFTALPQPSRVGVEVSSERTPELLPPGFATGDCVQRSWFVDVKAPLHDEIGVDLVFDYLQQNSIQHELGAIDERRGLGLWQLSEETWRKLPTHYNRFANTLSADRVILKAGQVSRFVACVSSQGQADR